jgi:hypothetical protein
MVYLVSAKVDGRRLLEIFSSEKKAKRSVLGRKPGATVIRIESEAAARCVSRHESLMGA